MDERRNESYCMDLTAYEAIKNIEREEEMMEILKVGEIWETDNAKPCLILAVHEKVCSILTLHDERKSESDLEFVTANNGIQYTNTAMISYKFKNLFEVHVETLSEEMFRWIQSMVAQTLGMHDFSDTMADYEEMYNGLKDDAERLMENYRQLRIENEDLKTLLANDSHDSKERIVLEAERDFWKEQAESYLERLLER